MASDASPRISGMKFHVEAILNTGPHDTVMRIGDQRDMSKPYAMKIVKREGPEQDVDLGRARAAFEASAKMGHPAILKYHDHRLCKKYLIIPDRAELLMELVEGKSLDRLEGLKVGHWALIFRQVAAALAHMHRRGVRHGDMKPSKAMLSASGQVKVLGYGLSIVREKDKTAELGTRMYMAPEQRKEKVIDDQTDVYNLGATMYHVLTGQPARRGEGEGKASTPMALNPQISTGFNALIMKCLQSSPGKRPESMYQVQQELDGIVEDLKRTDNDLRGLSREKGEG
jgi:eukaryotic-like serine/threonine-protein kinase